MGVQSKKIYEMLKDGKAVYMIDDFLEVAVRFHARSKDDLYRVTHLKYKGRPEHGVPQDNDTAAQVQMGGRFVEKAEYDAY